MAKYPGIAWILWAIYINSLSSGKYCSNHQQPCTIYVHRMTLSVVVIMRKDDSLTYSL